MRFSVNVANISSEEDCKLRGKVKEKEKKKKDREKVDVTGLDPNLIFSVDMYTARSEQSGDVLY